MGFLTCKIPQQKGTREFTAAVIMQWTCIHPGMLSKSARGYQAQMQTRSQKASTFTQSMSSTQETMGQVQAL